MPIGYACIALGVPNTAIKKCLIKNADEAHLHALIRSNISALGNMIAYNIKNGIRLFRISSDIIPFASSPVNTIPWAQIYGERLAALGRKAQESGMRLSMHPGQYTVLNSPNMQTAENAIRELEYHALFLDCLGVNAASKIILHVGGAYGDKQEAMRCFAERYQGLSDRVKARLVIENDDKVYNIQDVLEIGLKNRIPVVFDNLHHLTNPCADSTSEKDWIIACARTWSHEDGRQKIHYSQPDHGKKHGAHSLSIGIDEFLHFYRSLGDTKPDIMLEVKDKNISAVKCMLCTDEKKSIGALEHEWGRYKYLVLERSQQIYQQIRRLLKNKAAHPAAEFFRLTEAALGQPVQAGNAINAAMHVWGYFKDDALVRQKTDILKTLDSCAAGKASFASLKRKLYALSESYRQDYLLESYYFVQQYDKESGHDDGM